MYILGLSCYHHDAAAALLCDGQLVAAVEEERFTRRKHCSVFPHNAIAFCLREARIESGDLNRIAFFEQPDKRNQLEATAAGREANKDIEHLLREHFGITRQIDFLGHHVSHAAGSFLVSPFDRAAIITADGVGESVTTTWGTGHDNKIELLESIHHPHSIGLFFSALTDYLGFRINDAEWKVMGMASYGKPRLATAFHKLVNIHDDGTYTLNMDYFQQAGDSGVLHAQGWEKLLGCKAREPETEILPHHYDVACSGQRLVEDVMVNLARSVRKRTGERQLCLAGNVALNCVANWRILQESGFDDIFIQPACGDAGGAIGAAFYIYNAVIGEPRSFVMRHAFWGPAFSDDDISKSIADLGMHSTRFANEGCLLRQTAEMIAQGKVVAWFQGKTEFGPRALGARSLLADPRRPDIKETINRKVKFRESFRPFAPSVLAERSSDYFEMPENMQSPFMLLTPQVRLEKREELAATTHVDGTGRLQTVTASENSLFYQLIREFESLTGVPAVLNTSFNVRGEPIVCSPADALHTFCNTGIDALVIGQHLIMEKPAKVNFEAGLRHSIELEANELH